MERGDLSRPVAEKPPLSLAGPWVTGNASGPGQADEAGEARLVGGVKERLSVWP